MKHVIVVHNADSGNSNSLVEIKKAFAAHKIEPEYVAINAKNLHRHLQEASQRGNTTVVAAGGDGTINRVASQLHGTSCPLGIIPAGTLNHFAKELGIPMEIAKAVRIIVKGAHRQVDVGTVNDHVFLNNSSIGFYPRSLRTRDAYDRHIGKWPAAIVGFLRAAIRPHHYHTQITIDDQQHTLRTPFVFVGNNEYKRGQLDMGERVRLDSGKIAVYVMKTSTPLGVIRVFAHTLFTKTRRTQDFVMYSSDECTIRTRHHRQMHVACDGEVLTLGTPLKYKSAHKSLRVIVP